MNWFRIMSGPSMLRLSFFLMTGAASADPVHLQVLDLAKKTPPPAVTTLGGGAIYDLTHAGRTVKPRVPLASTACDACPQAPQALLLRAAADAGLDPHLVQAVAWTESAFRPDAVSHKGAMGLMQLMPATAQQYGVSDPFDPWQNVQGGTRLLRDLLQRYAGDARLALAAYNAGAQAVERAGRAVPNYPETQAYVHKVLNRQAALHAQASGLEASRPPAGPPPALHAPELPRGLTLAMPHTRAEREAAPPARRIGNGLVLEAERPPLNLPALLDS